MSTEITRASFQADIPDMDEDRVQSYNLATQLTFNYQMHNLEFAFKKEFQ